MTRVPGALFASGVPAENSNLPFGFGDLTPGKIILRRSAWPSFHPGGDLIRLGRFYFRITQLFSVSELTNVSPLHMRGFASLTAFGIINSSRLPTPRF